MCLSYIHGAIATEPCSRIWQLITTWPPTNKSRNWTKFTGHAWIRNMVTNAWPTCFSFTLHICSINSNPKSISLLNEILFGDLSWARPYGKPMISSALGRWTDLNAQLLYWVAGRESHRNTSYNLKTLAPAVGTLDVLLTVRIMIFASPQRRLLYAHGAKFTQADVCLGWWPKSEYWRSKTISRYKKRLPFGFCVFLFITFRLQRPRDSGRSGEKVPRAAPGKKGAHKSDWAPLLRHIATPELHSPRTDITHFPFQYSYLSNMSKKLIFPRTITSYSQSLRNALWIASLSALTLARWLLCRCRLLNPRWL